MKLNNKGFAISGVLYSLLILFVTLFMGILTILGTTKFSFDKIKNDIINKMENSLYKEDRLNGADPKIKSGMIPVVIENNGTVKKADLTREWYNYNQKKWANVVTVTNDTKANYENASAGTVISEEDILTYLVWVPRFRYKLWYTEATDTSTTQDVSKVHSIDIIFETKNTTKSSSTIVEEYLTHPAFTFGTEELNGFWVGKFETGYSGATSLEQALVSSIDTNKIIIKPNNYAWRMMSVSNIHSMVTNMNADENIFSLANDVNSHLMKNTEWGAVAYLSHSMYGKGDEVAINNSSHYKTGCGSNSMDEANSTTCHNAYGTVTTYKQSTTGNISGIFDMSGGAWEYVMGYSEETTSAYDLSGFTTTTFPQDKYINKYSSTNLTQYSKRILGDATGEMGPFSYSTDYYSSWYNDLAIFPNTSGPWVIRGGDFKSTTKAGMFSFSTGNGDSNSEYSFRIVIS